MDCPYLIVLEGTNYKATTQINGMKWSEKIAIVPCSPIAQDFAKPFRQTPSWQPSPLQSHPPSRPCTDPSIPGPCPATDWFR